MAIETTIPMKIEMEITGNEPATDIEQNVVEGSRVVRFSVKKINGLPVSETVSGYFELNDSFEMMEPGIYRVTGHFGYVSYLPSKFGLISIAFQDRAFHVSNA